MKQQRQLQIKQIISAHVIETQDELIAHLQACGFSVTQATVSRDIRELRLVKVAENGCYRYALPQREESHEEGKYQSILRQSVVGMEPAGNLVVVKTYPGMANAAAAALDAWKLPDMVGSLAGDDTIFIAMRTVIAANEFCETYGEVIRHKG